MALTAVDPEAMSEVPLLSPGGSIIPKSGALSLDGLAKNGSKAPEEISGFLDPQGACRPAGVDPSPKEGFCSIDVSNAGDFFLVQKPGPDGGA
jgi:hypothetical protein